MSANKGFPVQDFLVNFMSVNEVNLAGVANRHIVVKP